MDINEVNKTIKVLESGTTTFDNCMKLAALYTVRDGYNKEIAETQETLPQYKNYCKVKKRYQMHEVGETIICESMQLVCNELDEFIHVVYSSTDTSAERDLIVNTLQQILVSLS